MQVRFRYILVLFSAVARVRKSDFRNSKPLELQITSFQINMHYTLFYNAQLFFYPQSIDVYILGYIRIVGELRVVQLFIRTAERDKLLVSALLDNSALVDDDYFVGVTHG